jgi:hypothetical protein
VKLWHKSVVALAVTSTLLTSCGGDSDEAAVSTPELVETQAPTVTTGFGAALDLGNGLSVTFSTPEHFTPGKYASNYTKGQLANKFSVTIKNGGTKELDPTTIVIASNAGGKNCVDVLDGDAGIEGAPADMVKAGASITFEYGVACSAKVGDPLNLSVSLGSALVAVDGKLA